MYSVMFTPENKKEVPSLLQGNPNNGNGLVKSCITNIVISNTYTCSHLNCKYNLHTIDLINILSLKHHSICDPHAYGP